MHSPCIGLYAWASPRKPSFFWLQHGSVSGAELHWQPHSGSEAHWPIREWELNMLGIERRSFPSHHSPFIATSLGQCAKQATDVNPLALCAFKMLLPLTGTTQPLPTPCEAQPNAAWDFSKYLQAECHGLCSLYQRRRRKRSNSCALL